MVFVVILLAGSLWGGLGMRSRLRRTFASMLVLGLMLKVGLVRACFENNVLAK